MGVKEVMAVPPSLTPFTSLSSITLKNASLPNTKSGKKCVPTT